MRVDVWIAEPWRTSSVYYVQRLSTRDSTLSNILELGSVVADRYLIEAYVGAGGMQEVYRAMDQSLHRTVAVKVPKNESGQKRFQRSAAMSAKVTHPNVAKTFDYLEDSGRQF